MIYTTLVLLSTLVFITLWLALSHVLTQRHLERRTEIVKRGDCCQGRVIAVQRPFFLDSTTRLYFEFAPPGTDRRVQCCHTEHHRPGELRPSLPAAGMKVTVRYLPERPEYAVIGKLA